MSIPYIEMRCNLWTNPKVQRMAKEAKAPIASIIGGLHWFWSQVHEHGECDRVASLTADMVDKAVRVKGFAKAAETAGWIVFDSDGAQAPRWEESSTANAKERQRLYEAKRKLRWRKQLSEAGIEECPQNVPDKSGTSPGQVRDCPRQTEQNRTQLSKTQLSRTKHPPTSSEPIPVGFHAETESMIARIFGSLSASDRRRIAEWSIGIEVAESLTINGEAVPCVRVAQAALVTTEASNVLGSVKGFLAYADSTIARCRREGVNPGEAKASTPATFKIIQPKRDYDALLDRAEELNRKARR